MNSNAFQSPKNLIHYFLKPYYGVFLWLIFLGLLSVISGQLIPWQIAQIINLISESTDKTTAFSKLLPMFYKLAFLTAAAFVSGLWSFRILQLKCIAPASLTIRKELFSEMLIKDCQFWNTHTAGDVWSKIVLTQRTIAAQSSLGSIFYSGYAVCLSMIMMIFLLFRISPNIAIVAAASGGILLLFYNFISNNIKKSSVQLAAFEASVLGKVVNTLSNYFILKTFGTEKREQKNLEHEFKKVAKAKQKNGLINMKNTFLLEISILSIKCGIVLYAVFLWTEHQIKAGDIVYVMTSVSSFCSCISSISWLIPFMKSREAILSKNIGLFSKENEITNIKGAKKLKIKNGTVEIKNLTFSYTSGSEILNSLSLYIKPKEKVGIVGTSGSGKSTLLSLIQRLINTPQGAIFIDGQDITKVTRESLCNVLSFIPQDTSLFHRTVFDNIKYGKMTASAKAVKIAAASAFADEFIKNLPLGYNTQVGDKGVKLSGGERQRISIARAILKDAPILILDEATSALDSESETFIQKAIDEIIKDKTVIAVAHRLSTLKNMDRIIVLEKGKIIEEGRPEDLLQQKGKFYEFWQLQRN